MKPHKIISLILLCGLIAAVAALFPRKRPFLEYRSQTIVHNTWNGFKKYFIYSSGRVLWHEQEASAGAQALTMLRAVWMEDKRVFDLCYGWTEQNLSRRAHAQDDLLAASWKDGQVVEWMPQARANLDYALALLFASVLWQQDSPAGLPDYFIKGSRVMADILAKLTIRTSSSRLYLAPWIIEGRPERIPLNPSYFSPGHFRYFYDASGDARWLELADTTYFLLRNLGSSFNGQEGIGLLPDWCSVDMQDDFYPLPARSSDFGAEAAQIPLRVAMDHYWFGTPEAQDALASDLANFLEAQWGNGQTIFAGYGYDGRPLNQQERPLFYAAAGCLLRVTSSQYADQVLSRLRGFLVREEKQAWFYGKDCYEESLAWYVEGFEAGILRIPQPEER